MPLFRKNQPAKTTNAPPPSNRDDPSPSFPQTRIFFVLDEMPEDSPPAQPAVPAEQTYREALEEAVDSLLQETQAAGSARHDAATNESSPYRPGLVAQSIPPVAASTPEQPCEPEPEHSEAAAEAVPSAESTAPEASTGKRANRKKPAQSPTTPPQQAEDTRRSTRRLHVRRELHWDDQTSDEHRS